MNAPWPPSQYIFYIVMSQGGYDKTHTLAEENQREVKKEKPGRYTK